MLKTAGAIVLLIIICFFVFRFFPAKASPPGQSGIRPFRGRLILPDDASDHYKLDCENDTIYILHSLEVDLADFVDKRILIRAEERPADNGAIVLNVVEVAQEKQEGSDGGE